MKISIIYFTKNGIKIAEKIVENTENSNSYCGFGTEKVNFLEWTKDRFRDSDALVFISAMGICVRAIAPCIKDKITDPAVIVIDDKANFCISVLSGHIGGANDLVQKISKILNSTPVITTATDVNSVFAIDNFAKKNNFVIENTQNIKKISSKLLNNEKVLLKSDFSVKNLPKNIETTEKDDFDLYIGYKKKANADFLILRPKILNIGIGCRKNAENITDKCIEILKENSISEKCIKNIASIDIKYEELSLLEFAKFMKIKPIFYSVGQLSVMQGNFTQSQFVKRTVGVDNVCERCAVMLGGDIILKKTINNGVTLAITKEDIEIDFNK